MEFFIVVMLFVIIVMLQTAKTTISDRIKNLEGELERLRDTIKTNSPRAPIVEPEKPKQDYWKSNFEVVTTTAPAKPEPAETSLTSEEPEDEEEFESAQPVAAIVAPADHITPRIRVEPPPAKPGFFERNPDLEKFIGENL